MKVLIIGATGHVGASAVTNLSPRHHVTAVSRTTNPGVDLLEPRSIELLFRAVGEVDAVVSAFGSVPFRAAGDLDRADVVAGFTGKVLSQIDLIRIGLSHVRSRGSFTLTTGVVGREVIATGSVAAMANGAVEAWVRSAARELPRHSGQRRQSNGPRGGHWLSRRFPGIRPGAFIGRGHGLPKVSGRGRVRASFRCRLTPGAVCRRDASSANTTPPSRGWLGRRRTTRGAAPPS